MGTKLEKWNTVVDTMVAEILSQRKPRMVVLEEVDNKWPLSEKAVKVFGYVEERNLLLQRMARNLRLVNHENVTRYVWLTETINGLVGWEE